jgi:DNA-binding NtrC family response regulator
MKEANRPLEDHRDIVSLELPIEFITQPHVDVDPTIHTAHVVDHDSSTLLFLFDFLSNAGLRVSASSNAADAVDYASRLHPEILISELDMPGMDRLELLQRIREVSPSTRVILTSACADWPVYEEVLQRGGADLIPKPFNHKALLRAVERVLEGAK